MNTPAPVAPERRCPFGPRGRWIVTLLAEGHTYEQIGAELGVSDSTIHRQTWRLVQDAECNNRMHLVATSLRNGWIR